MYAFVPLNRYVMNPSLRVPVPTWCKSHNFNHTSLIWSWIPAWPWVSYAWYSNYANGMILAWSQTSWQSKEQLKNHRLAHVKKPAIVIYPQKDSLVLLYWISPVPSDAAWLAESNSASEACAMLFQDFLMGPTKWMLISVLLR